ALARSNAELEQFAYVASHDLQEPLRVVSGFLQLLQQRCEGKLGPEADEYIRYAIEGAHRMRNLIRDLLEYSRVGRRPEPFSEVDCNAIVQTVLANLQPAIVEQQGRVTVDPLPVVRGDATELTQLFQNLIANALKFRGPQPPEVRVSVRENKDEWVFSVRDNGIGIHPKDFERIFVIFQRLHTTEEYPGTGIGLALCRKIVERHGGRIWVESQPGEGATFYFTLPRNPKQAAS
ncbi:MAG: ATP-binding protein, partial [Verrucomicrobiae bacterium]|nr:ATP-binding protein [Verrucomicrobiae bacterium]